MVKSGTSLIEYIEPQEERTTPLLVYNSGSSSDRSFEYVDMIIKTLTEMCRMCKDMEDSKYK